MDHKTKEIIERLKEIFQRRRYGPGEYEPDFDILEPAISLIESLSERVGELERNLDFSLSCALSGDVPWTPDVYRRLEKSRALLSKQEDQG